MDRGDGIVGLVTAECEVDALKLFEPETIPTADKPAFVFANDDDTQAFRHERQRLILPSGDPQTPHRDEPFPYLRKLWSVHGARCRTYLKPAGRGLAGLFAAGALATVLVMQPVATRPSSGRNAPSTQPEQLTAAVPLAASATTALVRDAEDVNSGPTVTDAVLPRGGRAPVPNVVRGYRGTLKVDSRPAGASVFLNNQPVGRTPLVLPSLPVGSRAIRVELSGHQPWSRSVRIVANQSINVSASLDVVP